MGGAERLVGWRAGFTLIGLVVTLTIMAVVSSVAGFYYMQVLDDRKISVAKNELDALAKQVHAYLIRHGYQPITTTTFDFLAKDGTWPEGGNMLDGRLQILDPWGHEYGLDPLAGVVFSSGLDEVSGDDDIRVPYARTIDIQSQKPRSLSEDTVPPVILRNSPTGVIRVNNPVVQASFIDHFGGTIDPSSIMMWIDGERMTTGITSSAGQVLFSTAGVFNEGEHRVVVQVEDGADNIGRREWQFIVDTVAADVRITEPIQGKMITGVFDIKFMITENLPKSWKILWDSYVLDFDSPVLPLTAFAWQKPGGVNPAGDAQIPAALLADGLHHITLKLEDRSGRVYSDQVEVILDNTKPRVWITRNPPTGIGTPLKITTNIPQFRGWADDPGGMVKTVEYWYTKAPVAWVYTLPTAEPGLPRTACPVDYKGNPPANWMALYNSASEEWSTTAVNPLHYEATTVPADQLYLYVRATDLAGNQSTDVRTEFIVDPYGGGIFNQRFVDSTFNADPVYVPHRTISGLSPAAVNAGHWPTQVQTGGSIRFTCAQSLATSIWEVVVDDYSVGAPHEHWDDVLTKFPSVPCDWTSTGPNNVVTSVPRVAPLYLPHGTHRGVACIPRRGAVSCDPLAEGAYTVHMAYYGIPGPPRSAITTFFIDNTRPLNFLASDVVFRDSAGINRVVTDPYTITGFSNGALPYQLHFGGTARDAAPGQIARVWWAWDAVDPLKAPGQPGCGFNKCYPCPNFPHGTHTDGNWGSQAPSTTVSFGICGDVVTFNPMHPTTSDKFGFEGIHKLHVVAEDSAGLTVVTSRTIIVNCVGAVVEWVRLKNSTPPAVVTYNTTAAMRVVPEKRLDFNFRVSDELVLSGARYRILPIQVPAIVPGAGTYIAPPGLVTFMDAPTTNLVLTKDSQNNDFKSPPVSYALEVWGETAGVPGDIMRTKVQFTAMGGLAIVAPHFSAGATHPASPEANIRLLGWREQTNVAQYLYDHVRSFNTKIVFDYSGSVAGVPARASGYAGAPPNLAQWLSNNTANKSTDVLVVLDQGLQSMYAPVDWVKRFYWADKDGNGVTDSTTPENDVIVWMGPYPSSSYLDTLRGRQWLAGRGPLRDDQRKGFSDLIGDALTTVDATSMFARDEPLPDFQKIWPDPGNAPHANLYLPSLTSHNIGVFPGVSHLMLAPYTYDQGETHGKALVERLFTVDTIALGVNDCDSANFVYRHVDSRCRLAFFMTYGDMATIGTTWCAQEGAMAATPRHAVEPAPYVIQEFIDNWLTGQSSPSAGAKRLAYAADGSHAALGVPGGNASDEDVYYTPSITGGWTNVIPLNSANTENRAQGILGDGNTIVFSSLDVADAADGGPWAGRSLYKWEGGAVSRIFKCDNATSPIPSSGGVHVADNGHVVFQTANKGEPNANQVWPFNVIYHYRGSGSAVPITTGQGSDIFDAETPYISKNGSHITFATRTIYGQHPGVLGGVDNRPPAFTTRKSVSQPQVFRYAYGLYPLDPPPSIRYKDGWVTKYQTPWNNHASANPEITNDGNVVVFRCSDQSTSVKNWNLRFAVLLGIDWWWGRITRGDLVDIDVTAFSITPDRVRGGDVLPWIAFWSKGDFDGVKPDGGVSGMPPSNLTSSNCEGALPPSASVARLWLCTNVAEPLIPLVKLDAAGDTPGTVEFSQDGREIAFSADTAKVHFLMSWNGVTPVHQAFPPGGETMTKYWRPYRLRLGFDVASGFLRQPITATATMAVPDKGDDYGAPCREVFITK